MKYGNVFWAVVFWGSASFGSDVYEIIPEDVWEHRTPLSQTLPSKSVLDVWEEFKNENIPGALKTSLANIKTLGNVNHKDSLGNTALHVATVYGDLKVVKALISIPLIKIHQKNNDDQTALHMAIHLKTTSLDQIHIVADLLDSSRIQLSKILTEKIIHLFRKYQAAINIPLENGETLLYMAAKNGYTELVKGLIRNGADVNIAKENPPATDHPAEDHNWTPLHIAAWNVHEDVVEILIKAGAIVKKNMVDI